VLCWQLWLSLLAVSLITKKQKVPRSWSPSRTWCLRYGIPHFLEICQAAACSWLLTVLSISFHCKRPGCWCRLLDFDFEGSTRLLSFYAPSNYVNGPGQFLASHAFHQLINIRRTLNSLGSSVTGVISTKTQIPSWTVCNIPNYLTVTLATRNFNIKETKIAVFLK